MVQMTVATVIALIFPDGLIWPLLELTVSITTPLKSQAAFVASFTLAGQPLGPSFYSEQLIRSLGVFCLMLPCQLSDDGWALFLLFPTLFLDRFPWMMACI